MYINITLEKPSAKRRLLNKYRYIKINMYRHFLPVTCCVITDSKLLQSLHVQVVSYLIMNRGQRHWHANREVVNGEQRMGNAEWRMGNGK